MKFLHAETMYRLQANALVSGATRKTWEDGRQAVQSLQWDIAGRCLAPVTIDLQSRTEKDRRMSAEAKALHMAGPQTRNMEMQVPCRKCAVCLRKRMWTWVHRAKAEIEAAERTWFITLTFKPEFQTRFLNLARMSLIKNGLDFDALKSSEQFQLRHRYASIEVTKFLKRVRKNTGASIRYMLVAEAHESGAPHYHALMHHTVETTVTYRNLENEWKHLGFFSSKLLTDQDKKAAWYVCKYLGKSADARVRASAQYGNASRPSDITSSVTKKRE